MNYQHPPVIRRFYTGSCLINQNMGYRR